MKFYVKSKHTFLYSDPYKNYLVKKTMAWGKKNEFLAQDKYGTYIDITHCNESTEDENSGDLGDLYLWHKQDYGGAFCVVIEPKELYHLISCWRGSIIHNPNDTIMAIEREFKMGASRLGGNRKLAKKVYRAWMKEVCKNQD